MPQPTGPQHQSQAYHSTHDVKTTTSSNDKPSQLLKITELSASCGALSASHGTSHSKFKTELNKMELRSEEIKVNPTQDKVETNHAEEETVHAEEQGTFTCFPKLPLELRHMVWKCFEPEPRIIRLYHNKSYRERYSNDSPKIQSPSIPVLLHTNAESRQVASKFHKLVRVDVPIYINLSIDTLCFDDVLAFLDYWCEKLRCGEAQYQVLTFRDFKMRLTHLMFENGTRTMRSHFSSLLTILDGLKSITFSKNCLKEKVYTYGTSKQSKEEEVRIMWKTKWETGDNVREAPTIHFR